MSMKEQILAGKGFTPEVIDTMTSYITSPTTFPIQDIEVITNALLPHALFFYTPSFPDESAQTLWLGELTKQGRQVVVTPGKERDAVIEILTEYFKVDIDQALMRHQEAMELSARQSVELGDGGHHKRLNQIRQKGLGTYVTEQPEAATQVTEQPVTDN